MEKFRSLQERDQEPDILLLDHRMPIKTGLDLAKDIIQLNSKIKIVILSADVTIKEKVIKMSCQFISKPFNTKKLLKLLTN